jgi:3-deoxy-7-phosphoheptulonate synthase
VLSVRIIFRTTSFRRHPWGNTERAAGEQPGVLPANDSGSAIPSSRASLESAFVKRTGDRQEALADQSRRDARRASVSTLNCRRSASGALGLLSLMKYTRPASSTPEEPSMLVVMQSQATEEQVRAVCQRIESLGLKAHPIPGAARTAIGITGNDGAIDLGVLESLPGVIECIPVSKPYKLVSRDAKQEDTILRIPTPRGEVLVGGVNVAMVAGPCAVETEAQCMAIAERIAKSGCRLFRGGAYKPRTSPYSFQGLGEAGLQILAKVREQHGFGIVTEAIDNESLDLVEQYADVIQIGARNMQNFSLLKRAGRAKKPVLLKRGMAATLDEFLMAAEYILSEGNYQVMLCERGVRTFSDFSRNTLDLAVVPAVKRRSHLPILVDPSHGTGKRHKVLPLSLAAVAVGADGLLVEVHHEPEKALSDGVQSILPEEFAQLSIEVAQIARVLHRHVN